MAVARSLKPGGRWLLNTGTVAESILVHLKPELNYELGNMRARFTNKYDVAESCLETRSELSRGEQTEELTNWQCVVTLAELKRMLAAAGLTTIATYGDEKGAPYELGSHQLYLVAERS